VPEKKDFRPGSHTMQKELQAFHGPMEERETPEDEHRLGFSSSQKKRRGKGGIEAPELLE